MLFPIVKKLETAVFPDSLLMIDDEAFDGCRLKGNLTFGKNLLKIGPRAFKSCFFDSVVIPKSLTSIAEDTFADTVGVSNSIYFNVEEGNKNFESEDGILFSKGKIKLWSYPQTKKDESYTIPDTVRVIGAHAFYGNSFLKDITIPHGVISLGDYAFSCCSKIKTITIPDSVVSIGKYAFSEIKKMENITIPASVTSIGEHVFNHCDNLHFVAYLGLENPGERCLFDFGGSGCSVNPVVCVPVEQYASGSFGGTSNLRPLSECGITTN